MHPCLELSQLTGLPSNIRACAQRACLDTETALDELGDLQEYLSRGSSQHLLILPVVHSVLDPTNIIRECHFGADAEYGGWDLLRARLALQLLGVIARNVTIPSDIIAELWPRVWDWIEFQCEYIVHVYSDILFQLSTVHLEIISRLAVAPGSKVVHPAIDTTPGVRLAITRAWKWILEDERAGSIPVFEVMSVIRIHSNDQLDEMVAGAGGQYTDLAALVVTQLNVFAEDLSLHTGGQKFFMIFLRELLANAEFHQCLLAEGIILALVTVVNGRVYNLQILHREFIDIYFDLLTKCLRIAPGYPWLIQALKAGLLTTLGDYGSLHMMENTPALDVLLSQFPQYLYCYSVLRHLEPAMEDFKKSDHVVIHNLRSSIWSTFFRLVKEKLAVKADFEARYKSMKFCDNMACATVLPKAKFRRCSQCLDTYYCSPECQSVDWEAGDHRNMCTQLKSEVFIPFSFDLSTREKAFLRHLIHRDYLRNKEYILNLRTEFMITSSEPFYTQFDYIDGDVVLDVLPAEDLRSLFGNDLANVYISRMAQSGGRMQLDVAIGAQGSITLGKGPPSSIVYPWIFPMRSDSPRLNDGLRDIVSRAEKGGISESEKKALVKLLINQSAMLELH
ncbi:hypothetical protein B0H16DRAFT_1529913 [Mycena metata]|uniref:MYND-type domain-containing protein n=1 Tax=Mycena metata TaxID=1033252 RepID=A0AAD7JF52_9AGAR|nr:hypothetical protein B0H16DRAFT_1529913 [Mycena metata]